jgi:hypothetical protein
MFTRKLLIATSLLTAGPAYAGGEIFAGGPFTCTTADCGATILNGTIKAFGPSAGKWTGEFFAGANECLRVFVFSQFADLQTAVVAPNGTTYRDDDGGGALRPLVKINPTPNNGWYTVSIGRFAGAASTGNFSLAYSRHNAGNPNCANPTVPRAAPDTAVKPNTEGEPRAPAAGEPGAK